MIVATKTTTDVQESIAALREELQRWLTLMGQIEQDPSKIRDGRNLQLIEGQLKSARCFLEQVGEPQHAKEYPISPLVEPQEITLPANLRPPGIGVPVKSKPGGVRLPDPAYFPKE